MDWPINVGGKPFNSWPAFVPIMFELTVLFAGLCTVGAMFAFNGLPNVRRKIFDPALTRDRYAIVIEAPVPSGVDPEGEAGSKRSSRYKAFSESEAAQFLKQLGAVKSAASTRKGGSDHDTHHKCTLAVYRAVLALGLSGCLHEEPNYDLHAGHGLPAFDQGSVREGDRLPVQGNGFARLRFLSVSRTSAARLRFREAPKLGGESSRKDFLVFGRRLSGQRAEEIRSVRRWRCSSAASIFSIPTASFATARTGQGDGYIVPKFPRPPTLQSDKVRNWPDGNIYHVITMGQNLMPSYASQILPADRWAVIHYVRALQRSQHPTAARHQRSGYRNNDGLTAHNHAITARSRIRGPSKSPAA